MTCRTQVVGTLNLNDAQQRPALCSAHRLANRLATANATAGWRCRRALIHPRAHQASRCPRSATRPVLLFPTVPRLTPSPASMPPDAPPSTWHSPLSDRQFFLVGAMQVCNACGFSVGNLGFGLHLPFSSGEPFLQISHGQLVRAPRLQVIGGEMGMRGYNGLANMPIEVPAGRRHNG